MFIIHLNVHSECRTLHFTTPNLRPAGLKFMVECTARIPNTWVLSGGAALSRDWLDIGWDVSEKLVYQTGFICPYSPLQYNIMAKIWPYNYTNNLQSLIGHQKCDKYYSVFAPGTLGIWPDTYLVPVSNGLGDRHIKNAMGVCM